jgi:acetoin utilization deacetylase AcuC-like enzyme
MRDACAELGAPIGCVLEGGYDLGALSRSVAATMEALVGGDLAVPDGEPVALAREARTRLAPFWPALG